MLSHPANAVASEVSMDLPKAERGVEWATARAGAPGPGVISRLLRGALFTVLGIGIPAFVAVAQEDSGLTHEVNTFIGSKDDGNTFPGASAPFGQIQVSPIGSHYAGWRYDDPKIRGFGHSFLSGAGCWEQGGLVSVLPVTGTIGPNGDFDTGDAKRFDQKNYGSTYRHEGEVGQAGYYRVHLDEYGGIDAEATALTRAAGERYTFPAKAGTGHVLVNVGQANERHGITGSSIEVVGDRAVEGKLVSKSFCGGRQYTTWFRIEFDRPVSGFGTWDEEGGVAGSRHSMEGEAKPNGAWLSFDLGKGHAVTAISAISHVDAEGARNNLRSEGMRAGRLLSFDQMRRQAQATWSRELQGVRVRGGSADDRTVFYTALYHALLQPMTGSDADGRYRGYDELVHRADDWTYYEYFSLWDTYRSQNQWLAMTHPQRARDIARSLLAIDEQGGWLPRWGYANFDTNIMTGDPVTPFLVDLWRFGALQGDEAAAYAALRRNAFGLPPPQSRHAGRSGNESYLQHGFVQYDSAFPSKGMDVDPHHGGSATLEYALADCALSQMAGALGRVEDAALLRQRGATGARSGMPTYATTKAASRDSRDHGWRTEIGIRLPAGTTARARTTASTKARPGSTNGWHNRMSRDWWRRCTASRAPSSGWTGSLPTTTWSRIRRTPRARPGWSALTAITTSTAITRTMSRTCMPPGCTRWSANRGRHRRWCARRSTCSPTRRMA